MEGRGYIYGRINVPFTYDPFLCDSIATMKKIVITYSSIYGSAKKYAEALAERISVVASDASLADLSDTDLVVHIGGLYAGTMAGLKSIACRVPDAASLYVVSVGIADPGVVRNARAIDDLVWKHVPAGMKGRVRIFHLRGRLDYPSMTARHRAMMWMLCSYIKSKDHRTDEDEAVLESYGGSADFIDLSSLDSAESFIRSVLEKDE